MSLSRRSARLLRKTVGGGLLAGIVLAGALVLPTPAQAALADHTVPGVSPRGTTINLFDYWRTGRDDPDDKNTTGVVDVNDGQGINEGHKLKFVVDAKPWPDETVKNPTEQEYRVNNESQIPRINRWTRSAHPRVEIVNSLLGNDGYPTLSEVLGGESLAYLFNSRSGDYKQAYRNVGGLLQIDGEGYYYYDSKRNFAEFNEATNDFVLYDEGGVTAAGESPHGQFFPFNKGEQVFSEQDGQLVDKDVNSRSPEMNHYFGMTMSTRFVQQYGGHTDETEKTSVTYNFSGDDDVWVFIDGVLVGDLGGIHDGASLQIDFSTGEVIVYDDNTEGEEDTGLNNKYDEGETVYFNNTLEEIFEGVGRKGGFTSDTFADDTYHTLDFFYLERGNVDSNMSLRYNLVNIPESGILKVTQDGEPIEGVGFELYKANEGYEIGDESAFYTGTTDADGKLVFTTQGAEGGEPLPVSLEQLEKESAYWVLRETKVPEGYRNPGDMHLRFKQGVLLSDNEWDTGAYSQAHVTARATSNVYKYVDGEQLEEKVNLDTGTLFAVVFQNAKGDVNDESSWHPISGDAFKGWTVEEGTKMGAAIAAAQKSPYQFVLGSGGAYEVDIDNLPGDVLSYYWMIANNAGDVTNARYTVAYYYTEADSIKGATVSNTYRLQADAIENVYEGFGRTFSVTLNIANVRNELELVKTDAVTGDPIKGAEFALYKADGEFEQSNAALNTFTTDKNGRIEVTSDAEYTLLANGRYVLVETSVPDGYALEKTPIQIVVDDDGVHVNAGAEDDNVSVTTGIGSVVYSMVGFAAEDDVDVTLHDVKAMPQSAGSYDGPNTQWTDVTGESEKHFKYNDESNEKLHYVPTDLTYTAEAGWSRLNLTQCNKHRDTKRDTYYEELDENQSLNRLFTGDVTINVTNEPTIGNLEVTKEVTGEGADKDKAFEFTITELCGRDGEPLAGSFPAGIYDASNKPVGEKFSVGTANGARMNFSLKDGQTLRIEGLPAGATYQITETTAENYTSSNTVNGKASENGSVASGTIPHNDKSQVEYTNAFSYTPNPWNLDLKGSKVLVGRDFKDGDSFTFTIAAGKSTPDAPLPVGNDGVPVTSATVTPKSDTSVSFAFGGTITFEKPGEYRYIIRENIPENDEKQPGIDYDQSIYRLSVVIVANEDGTLRLATPEEIKNCYPDSDVSYATNPSLEVRGPGEPFKTVDYEEGVLFENEYAAESASVALEGTKSLENETLTDGAFEFRITPLGSNTDGGDTFAGDASQPMPESATTTNGADGDVLFGEMTFDQSMIGKTYGYKVTEVVPAVDDDSECEGVQQDGITYDTSEHVVKVTVGREERDGKEHVTLAVTPGGSGKSNFAFTNTYDPTPSDPSDPSESGISFKKVLVGRDRKPLAEGEFTFVMTSTDDAGISREATNATDGSVTFEGISFDRPGIYSFKVSEKGAGETNAGVTNSTKTYRATAEVADDGNGKLVVSWSIANADGSPVEAEEATFENVYEVSRGVSVTLGAKKVLLGEGAALKDGQFTFELRDESGELVQTATNDASGAVTFAPLEFAPEDEGTHVYTISEKNDGQEGVTYDSATFEVRVTVEDNGEGGLAVTELTYNGAAEPPTFTNRCDVPEGPVPEEPEPGENKPENSGNTPSDSGSDVPHVGDVTVSWLPGVIGCAGAVGVAVALWMRRRGQSGR